MGETKGRRRGGKEGEYALSLRGFQRFVTTKSVDKVAATATVIHSTIVSGMMQIILGVRERDEQGEKNEVDDGRNGTKGIEERYSSRNVDKHAISIEAKTEVRKHK